MSSPSASLSRPESANPTSSATSGIPVILVTVFAMALADAIIKFASTGMTLWQIYVLRSLLVVPVLVIMASARRSSLPAPGQNGWGKTGWILLRSLCLTLMYLGIYAAIPLLDLSVIAASLYTGPLFIVLLSALALHERITARHWGAILTGFAGVLLIVRPAAEGFTPLALIPVSAAFLYAVSAIMTRAKCADVATTTLALWLNGTLLTVGAAASLTLAVSDIGAGLDYPFLFGPWSALDGRAWGVVLTLAVLMGGISIGLARAYQSPRPQVIAAFDYAYLIFAALWGYLFFGEVPDAVTLVGMTLIAGAGIGALYAGRAQRQS